jgi:hypothetical protein
MDFFHQSAAAGRSVNHVEEQGRRVVHGSSFVILACNSKVWRLRQGYILTLASTSISVSLMNEESRWSDWRLLTANRNYRSGHW